MKDKHIVPDMVSHILIGTQPLLEILGKSSTIPFLLALYAREKEQSDEHSWGYTKGFLKRLGLTANDNTYRERMGELEQKGYVKSDPIDPIKNDYTLTEKGRLLSEGMLDTLNVELYAPKREFLVGIPPKQQVTSTSKK
jgi:hypothetical protein